MPKWAWWVFAALLFVLWNYDSIGDYWFGGWWMTVRHKPLGEWYAFDLLPFIAAYLALRPLGAAFASMRTVQEQEKAQGEAQSQAK
jgi:hypothetical protein